MYRRHLILGTSASLPAGCGSLGGADIPGLFYRVQFKEARPTTVCMDLAGELISRLPLGVIDDQVFQPKGQCIVTLGSQEQPDVVVTSIVWHPENRSLVIHLSQLRRADMAAQVVAIAQSKFPDTAITSFTPKYTLVGP
jgi:hypothetical protein